MTEDQTTISTQENVVETAPTEVNATPSTLSETVKVEETKPEEETTIDVRGTEETKEVSVEAPDWVEEGWWNKESNSLNSDKIKEAMESKDKQIKDFRRLVSKGNKAPEKAEDYAFELHDSLKSTPFAQDNELQDFIKGVMFDNGLSVEQANKFVNDYMTGLMEKGFVEKPLSEEEQKIADEKFISEEKNKIGPEAEKIITGAIQFIDRSWKSGTLNENEKEMMIKLVDQGANGILLVDKIRQMTGEKPIPIIDANIDGLESDEDIARGMVEEKYDQKQLEKIFQQRAKAGRPVRIDANLFPRKK